ncbi:DNA-binding transcriptional MerR regulator [Anaerosolibacter carboniphilus]|uniref:DNA-binding transcriptional MerR regulator n=1 Tax=Anaerosolibacter carboniphilus TaxID=1417629 RepID=A0A841KKK3_9FIRM|nr:MerR family transcriptional regulator [Anaerosolibacter carboniphilus]MBB6214394.1 DNA-binding transcriptional MerR regulator [Anaerosolibacter carboniphilus]
MYTIGQIAKKFNLSRSTLLYYDAIGLLNAHDRTHSNYRIYGEDSIRKLELISMYREAGVPLEDIKLILDSSKTSLDNILEKRLITLNQDIKKLEMQRQLIVGMLKNKASDEPSTPSKNSFVSVLRNTGLNDAEMDKLHREFERLYPQEHQNFLEFLGISAEEILSIREQARKLSSE